MMTSPCSSSAAELAALAGLSEVAQRWVQPELSGRALFHRLRAEKLWTDALKLWPHLVDKRAAVWWGCLCVTQARENPSAESTAETALGAAVRWVQNPCEETRRAAGAAAEPAGRLTTPPGCLAMAAFWSDGSMTPPELPCVPPPPHVTAVVVAGAVLLAGAPHALHHWAEIQQQFLELGRQVANDRLSWHHREHSQGRGKSRVQKRVLEAALAGVGEQR